MKKVLSIFLIMILSLTLVGCGDNKKEEANKKDDKVTEKENAKIETKIKLDYKDYIGKKVGELKEKEIEKITFGSINLKDENPYDTQVNKEGIPILLGSLRLPKEERYLNIEESIVIPQGLSSFDLNGVSFAVVNDSFKAKKLSECEIVGYIIFDVDVTNEFDTTGEEWYQKGKNYARMTKNGFYESVSDEMYVYSKPYSPIIRTNSYVAKKAEAIIELKNQSNGRREYSNVAKLSNTLNKQDKIFNSFEIGLKTFAVKTGDANDKFYTEVKFMPNESDDKITTYAYTASIKEFESENVWGYVDEGSINLTEEKLDYLIKASIAENVTYEKWASDEKYALYIKTEGNGVSNTEVRSVAGYIIDKVNGIGYDFTYFSISGDSFTKEFLLQQANDFYEYVSTHITVIN